MIVVLMATVDLRRLRYVDNTATGIAVETDTNTRVSSNTRNAVRMHISLLGRFEPG